LDSKIENQNQIFSLIVKSCRPGGQLHVNLWVRAWASPPTLPEPEPERNRAGIDPELNLTSQLVMRFLTGSKRREVANLAGN
jgi:hypothetical protein